MVMHVLVTALLLGGAPAPKDPPADKTTGDGASRRVQFLVDSLQRRLPLDKPLEAPLKEILDYLEDIATLPGSETDPLIRLKVVPNDAAFKAGRGETFRVEDETLRLPKLPGATLESVLEVLCEQLGATVIVRRDYIELTPFAHYTGRERRPGESPFFVHQFVAKQPLADALDRLAERYGRTVIIDPKVADKAREAVTAKLLNVPFDTAIELLADLADLNVVRKGKALFVTTADRAKTLRTEQAARPAKPAL